jgi:hypothetical protein
MRSRGSGVVDGSFRDPSGFVFSRDEVLYRQVNESYREHYECLMSSGLYQALTSAGLMVAHEESAIPSPRPELAFRIIRPEVIPFISFPYEWSFSQLKAAALATLAIQRTALKHGMTLKDASAYNIQFRDTSPILIDTLSFERHKKGRAWIAYRQFCQHFLAPLALMAIVDARLGLMMRDFIDGIPLDLASGMLPIRSRLKMSLLLHIHLHAKSQARYGDPRHESKITASTRRMAGRKVSLNSLLALLDSLSSAVANLRYAPGKTQWSDYYSDNNYSSEAMEGKAAIVREFIGRSAPDSVWDLGANTGFFSRIASDQHIRTVSFDIDPAAVEINYRNCRARQEKNLLPLVLDLTNPSPSIGWENRERDSLLQRAPVATAMALALIHHLAIANNVPLDRIARFFSIVCHSLIVEFVPKNDSQVQRLLSSREDVFPDYTKQGFERAFDAFFSIIDSRPIPGSERIVYLMENRSEHTAGPSVAAVRGTEPHTGRAPGRHSSCQLPSSR